MFLNEIVILIALLCLAMKGKSGTAALGSLSSKQAFKQANNNSDERKFLILT